MLQALDSSARALLTYLAAYLMRSICSPPQVSVLSGICLCYLLMQTFAIPGTLGLSILCGALYGVKWGWLLVAGALPGVGAGEVQRLYAPGCMV